MSDQYRLLILPEAQNDIRGIIIYITNDLAVPQAARNLKDNLETGINSLKYEPKRIKTVDEQPWKDAGIRK